MTIFKKITIAFTLLATAATALSWIGVEDALELGDFRFLGIVLIFIIFGGGLALSETIEKKMQNAIKENTQYDKNTRTLSVSARHIAFISIIEVVQAKGASLQYNPAQLTYTSTTVGNVTVGSLDFEDESTSLKLNNTGVYRLEYASSEETGPIDTIELSEELATQVRNKRGLPGYLNGNELVLRGGLKEMSEAEQSVVSDYYNKGTMQSNTVAGNILLQNMKRSGLSRAECKRIRRWLCGF